MRWTSEQDEEYEDLMLDYELWEPALDRAARFEDRLDRLEALLNSVLEKKAKK